MSLTSGEKWGLAGGATLVAFGVSLALGSSANAATMPAPLVGPTPGQPPAAPDANPAPSTGYTPPTRTLQSRPLSRADQMPDAQRRDTVAIAQAQLNALSYGPLVVDGINGGHTQSAAARFNVDHSQAVAVYVPVVGEDRAIAYAIDDAFRAQTHAAPAPDHVPAPSGALWKPGRRARRPW